MYSAWCRVKNLIRISFLKEKTSSPTLDIHLDPVLDIMMTT